MGINEILMLMIVFLVILIMVLGIIYLKMHFGADSGTKKNKDKNEGDTKTATKTSGGTTEYTKESVFSFMEFDGIENNMIVQKKGKRFLMAVECQGINYDLMSGLEKHSVEEGFQQFLNTLRHPVQIYMQTRTINLEASLREL